MGYALKSVPSGKEYTGQKFTGTLDLQALVKEINELSQKEVIERLAQYKDVFPGRSPDKNTYEMMGLYQAALQYLGYDTITIDGRFGPATHQVLKTAQKDDLKFADKDCDGLPGPTTTKALIEALQAEKQIGSNAPSENSKLNEYKDRIRGILKVSRLDFTEKVSSEGTHLIVEFSINDKKFRITVNKSNLSTGMYDLTTYNNQLYLLASGTWEKTTNIDMANGTVAPEVIQRAIEVIKKTSVQQERGGGARVAPAPITPTSAARPARGA